MEASRHLVALTTELPTSVQHGEHHFCGSELFILVVDPHRNAPTIIRDLTRTVLAQSYLNGRAVTGHCLVHGVVHDLPHQVVETGRTCGPDVHPRSFSDGLETLQNGDIGFAVGRLSGRHRYRSPVIVGLGKTAPRHRSERYKTAGQSTCSRSYQPTSRGASDHGSASLPRGSAPVVQEPASGSTWTRTEVILPAPTRLSIRSNN